MQNMLPIITTQEIKAGRFDYSNFLDRQIISERLTRNLVVGQSVLNFDGGTSSPFNSHDLIVRSKGKPRVGADGMYKTHHGR